MDFMLIMTFLIFVVALFGLKAVRSRQLKLGLALVSLCSTMVAAISGNLMSLAKSVGDQVCERCFFVSGGSRFLLDIGETGIWLLSGMCWLVTFLYINKTQERT